MATDITSAELAAQDIGDIVSLQAFEPFNRWMVRRLKERQESIHNRILNDPPTTVDHEEREILRRLYQEYQSILEMPARELIAAKNVVEADEQARIRKSYRRGMTGPNPKGVGSGYT
jgi:hypothetical protein